MSSFTLGHLADHVLLQELKTLVRQDRATTAALLAHLAEVDARRLYARTDCPSMFHYCVRKLGFSEDVAAKRIHAARAARMHPAIFAAVAEGRLHLAGVTLLAPVLTKENVAELLAAAAHKSRREVEKLVAYRFPKPDVPEQLRPLAPEPARATALPVAQPAGPELATLGPSPASSDVMEQSRSYAPGHVAVLEIASEAVRSQPVAAAAAPAPAPRERITPLSPGHYSFESTFDEEIVELLDRAKALLGHTLPSRNRTEVLRRVLRDWVQAAERRKFGLTDRPRTSRKGPASERTIPNALKRAVMKRDGGRCTFVGGDGQRCESCDSLEFDHVTPLARGGLTTANNLRLLCRPHNQYEAERALGAGFMEGKRTKARHAAAN